MGDCQMQNLKISKKLLVMFLVTALIPMLVLAFVSYNQSKTALIEKTNEKMFIYGSTNYNRIEQYFQSKLENGWVLSQTARIINAVSKFHANFKNASKFAILMYFRRNPSSCFYILTFIAPPFQQNHF